MASARPLVLVLVALLAGLLPGLRYGAPAGLAAAVAVCLFAAPVVLARSGLRVRPQLRAVAPLGAFACIGMALGGAERRAVGDDCRAAIGDQADLRVVGVLAANAIPAAEGSPPLLPIYARGVEADGRHYPGCGGVVRVRLPEHGSEVRAGTVLLLNGTWTRSTPPVVRSGWPSDPRYSGFLLADSATILRPPVFAASPLLTLRGWTESHLYKLFPQHGPLAEALLLGRRERVDPVLRDRYARAGMAHLLAISGMHVGLIAGMLLLVGNLLRRLVWLSRRAPVWIAIGGIVGYLLVIGAPPSAVRAGIMICLALLGLLLQRPFSPYSVVAAAALAILVARPMTLLEPGFQLSFAGVLGILLLREALFTRLPESWRADGWRRYTAETTVVSAAAFIATAPAVVWHFGLISPVGLVSNLAAIPVMGLALAGLVAAAIVAPLFGPAGSLLALGTEAAFHLLGRIAEAAAAVPYGHGFVPRPQAWVWLVGGVVFLLTADAAGRLRSGVRWAAATGAALVVLGAAPAVAGIAGAPHGSLELHFLDVGQGDAVAIRTPGDRWLLVDAGPATDRFDAGERRVLPFLRARGVRRLEGIILSHPHLDHIGGAPAVLRSLTVGALIEPGYVTGSAAYLETLRVAESRGVIWRAARSGRTLELDGVRFEFLWPDSQMLDAATDANEISAIVAVRFGDFAALLTGDAYIAQEHLLVRRHGAALRAQLLKAGHHGSYTSTSGALLDAVRPELVVISAGRRNRFGHPAPEVVDELSRRNIRIARTDRHGTVTIIVEGGRRTHWYLAEP
jgi:competence protein ComEC